MKALRLPDRSLGPGHPALLVAEVGINHNGDLDLARRCIDAAAEAGADAVKFQNYRTEDFVPDRSLTYSYVSAGKPVVESQYEMFKRCELTREGLAELALHCAKRAVLFFSTPTSEEGVQDLVHLKAPLLKNGSDYLQNLPLIRVMASTGIPTVLSTGMATLAEIDDAVRAFRGAGGTELVLLHCTSAYPTPPPDVHLRKIATLAAAFDCPAGFSDHTEGIVAAVGAVALGACFIEKHFTLDRDLPGPDHRFSSTPAEFAELVRSVRLLEANLGQAAVGPTAAEAEARESYRLSCVAARELPGGHRLEQADLAFARPGTGLPPAAGHWLVGHVLTRQVPAGKILEPDDFIRSSP